MSTFFHGWRRKAGCVSLVMACAMMGMWIRSLHSKDVLQLRVGHATVYFVVSNQSWVYWQSVREAFPSQLTSPQQPPGAMGPPQIDLTQFHFVMAADPVDHFVVLSTQQLSVLMKRQTRFFVGMKMKAWGSPYWAIVMPLTLLSAYLILWKPRKKA